MGTTPTYALPYPELTDVANVPADMRELAEATEAVLNPVGNGQPSIVTQANTVQALANGSETTIVYQLSQASQTGMFTNGGTTITLPVAGLYLIIFGYSFGNAAAAAGARICVPKITGSVNGSQSVPGVNVGTPGITQVSGTVTIIRGFNAGATVAMNLYQSSGAAIQTNNQAYPSIMATRLAASPF